MKLLLVNAINTEAPDRLHPPLGLAYIAASLRKEFGNEIECRIIDGNTDYEIRSFKPDIVGITSVSRNYNIAKGHAAIAKQYNLPVIIGGVHISVLPETMTDDMDVAVIGEGEDAIRDLLFMYSSDGHFNGKTIEAPELIKPLDSIPFPARDLLTIGKHASMISSRGCPYRCTFCATSRHTRNQVRYHSAEYVAEEIELLYRKYKASYITIYDDLFAIDTKRVIRIQELLAAKNLIGKFRMAINIRANFVTDELAEILSQMNVHVVAIGAESGCQKTLDYLKSGGITVEDNARATRIIKKHNMISYCIFIIGSPYEDMDSVMQTVKFIRDNKIKHYDINVLAAYPGTPVWDYALSRGLVGNDMDWAKLDFHINPVILSEKLNRQQLMGVCEMMEKKKQKLILKRKIVAFIRHPLKYLSMKVRKCY